MKYLCFDIGGTYIKYAVYDELGQVILTTQKVKTQVDATSNGILNQVVDVIEQVQATVALDGIAISTAGVVDAADGSIRFAGPTIPGYTGTPIKATIEAKTQLPCAVLNDVNAACLGEYWQGLTESHKPQSLVCLTLGTGVGGAVMLDGKLVNGITDMAGELGYLPVGHSTLQELASTTALLQRAKAVHGSFLTGEQLFELVRTGMHPELETVLQEVMADLATGLLSVIYLLNPEVIILGGGILAQADLLLPLLHAALEEQVISPRFLTATIQPATLGNDAGMLGALYHLLTTT